MDIKLIPKEYKKNQDISSQGFKSNIWLSFGAKSGLWIVLTLSLLVFSLAAGGGLFVYRDYSGKQKDALQKEIDVLNKQRDYDLEKRVKDFDQAIKNINKYLAAHIYPTKLFKMIDDLTLEKVQFISFSADIEQGQLSLSGIAGSYDDLARQVKVFESDKRIVKADPPDSQLNSKGQIQFNIKIKFDPQSLRYQPSN